MSVVWEKTYPAPALNEREALRYAGMRQRTEQAEALLRDCAREAWELLAYRVCWARFPLEARGDRLDLTFARTDSRSLRACLSGCTEIVLFAATIGAAYDRLLRREALLSPARAQMLQALGAERVESLCDAFEMDIRRAAADEGLAVRPRFSPGYGDLPLALQKDVFLVLDCPRRIGVSLNENLLMSPSKSVTALIGLYPRE